MHPLTDTEQSQSILQIESLKARIEKNRENINKVIEQMNSQKLDPSQAKAMISVLAQDNEDMINVISTLQEEPQDSERKERYR